mgnify:CR=1 FL=1
MENKKVEEALKNHIVEEIFSEFPIDTKEHPYDLFMTSEVDAVNSVEDTPLGEKGYEVCEEYGLENIRNLRGLMQSKLNDLNRLLIEIEEIKK